MGIPGIYVCIAAMLGGQSVVSGKVLSLIMKSCFLGEWKELLHFRTYLVIFLWLFAAFIWVVHLNRALRIFYGAFIIPLTQVNWTVWTIVSGGVVYGEFSRMMPWQLVLFIFGSLLLLGGVSLLAPSKNEGLNSRLNANKIDSSTMQMVKTSSEAKKGSYEMVRSLTLHFSAKKRKSSRSKGQLLAKGGKSIMASPVSMFRRTASEPDAPQTFGLPSDKDLSPSQVHLVLKNVGQPEMMGFGGLCRELSNVMSVDCLGDSRHISMERKMHYLGHIEVEGEGLDDEVFDIEEPPFIKAQRKWKKFKHEHPGWLCFGKRQEDIFCGDTYITDKSECNGPQGAEMKLSTSSQPQRTSIFLLARRQAVSEPVAEGHKSMCIRRIHTDPGPLNFDSIPTPNLSLFHSLYGSSIDVVTSS